MEFPMRPTTVAMFTIQFNLIRMAMESAMSVKWTLMAMELRIT